MEVGSRPIERNGPAPLRRLRRTASQRHCRTEVNGCRTVRRRRHRAGAGRPERGRRAGDLPVGLRTGGPGGPGLRYGAAGYVVKPFSPTELLARIGAALRRREVAEPTEEPTEPYVLGQLTVDYVQRRVSLAGRPVALSALEYGLLAELSANGGRPLTYRHLQERVWGELDQEDLRPVRTMVGKLRRKLGDDSEYPAYIFTEARVGYRMPRGEGEAGEP